MKGLDRVPAPLTRRPHPAMNPLFRMVLMTMLIPSARTHAADAVQVATIENKEINESSGIACSYNHPGSIWLHNDSGDKARLYLVDLKGRTTAVVSVQGAKSDDWEDMCSFTMDGQSWLLIGDIGDNERRRGKKKNAPCRLYLLKEPVVPRSIWAADHQMERHCEDHVRIRRRPDGIVNRWLSMPNGRRFCC